jgi:hypothetical protein
MGFTVEGVGCISLVFEQCCQAGISAPKSVSGAKVGEHYLIHMV